MKDTQLYVTFTSATPLEINNLNESGLLQRLSLTKQDNTDNKMHFLKYQFVRDPRQISPDTLYGEIWASIFKQVFMQIQPKS